MIEPTPGRVVWFYPIRGDKIYPPDWAGKSRALAAIVVGVHTSRKVNLRVFDFLGHAHPRTEIQLLQDDDEPREGHPYAVWMPFQKGQAAKTEQLERETGYK